MNISQAAVAASVLQWQPSFVPYLSDLAIEQAALAVLMHYGRRFSPIVQAPVPIDDIAELLLQLTVEIGDLRELCHTADGSQILGMLDLGAGVIRIDKHLLDSRQRSQQRRYNFTLAHEVGHWCLHRHMAMRGGRLQARLDRVHRQPSSSMIVCRSGDRGRLELQADRFASLLLMPRRLILEAYQQQWEETLDPLRFWGLQGLSPPCFEARHPLHCGGTADHCPRGKPLRVSRTWLDRLAIRFRVSRQAMVIRLTTLRLLRELDDDEWLPQCSQGSW